MMPQQIQSTPEACISALGLSFTPVLSPLDHPNLVPVIVIFLVTHRARLRGCNERRHNAVARGAAVQERKTVVETPLVSTWLDDREPAMSACAGPPADDLAHCRTVDL